MTVDFGNSMRLDFIRVLKALTITPFIAFPAGIGLGSLGERSERSFFPGKRIVGALVAVS